MVKRLHALSLMILAAVLSTPLVAAAKTKHKSKSSSEKNYSGDGRHRSDPEMRTLVRKQAPFIVEERARGHIIRLNKDGTFSRERDAGAYATEGHWKILAGKLRLKWSTGEEYDYRMAFSGKTPIIGGRKPNKERHYVLSATQKS
jgi:hypothetical protein